MMHTRGVPVGIRSFAPGRWRFPSQPAEVRFGTINLVSARNAHATTANFLARTPG
jgi:hypothetical protein